MDLNENSAGFPAEIEQRLASVEVPGKLVNRFISFGQFPLVRFLAQAGKDANITLRGIRSWGYADGGYRAVLEYELVTPEGTFEATVTVHGAEAPNHEYEQRQWHVELTKTSLLQDEAHVKLTPYGASVGRLYLNAHTFADGWKDEMGKPGRGGAFALMLPSGEREKALADLEKVLPLAALAGPFGASLAVSEGAALQQAARFLAGSMIRVEPKRFIVSDNERDEVVAKAHNIYHVKIDLARTPPLRRIEGGHILLSYDLQLSKPGDFVAECILDIEGDANALESSNPDAGWRVVSLRIISGKKTPPQPLQEALPN